METFTIAGSSREGPFPSKESKVDTLLGGAAKPQLGVRMATDSLKSLNGPRKDDYVPQTGDATHETMIIWRVS